MEFATIEWQPIVVITALMVLDIITGFAGAVKDKAVESGKMREGLWHKAGFFGLVALAALYEVATAWLNFELAGSMGIAVPELPAVDAVCVFIAITEAVSIVENLRVINPQIANLPGVSALQAHDPAAPDLTVEIEEEEVE